MKQVVRHTKDVFRSWTKDEQEAHCDALTSLKPVGIGEPTHVEAMYDWDIVELKDYTWVHLYQPECSKPNSDDDSGCNHTVQVDGGCHYMGSANYVIFGLMCKLCEFSYDKMFRYIYLYKGGGGWPVTKKAGNYAACVAWAAAGWGGWGDPQTAEEASFVRTPPGDRNDCKAICPIPYGPRPQPGVKLKMQHGGPFHVHWSPNYTG